MGQLNISQKDWDFLIRREKANIVNGHALGDENGEPILPKTSERRRILSMKAPNMTTAKRNLARSLVSQQPKLEKDFDIHDLLDDATGSVYAAPFGYADKDIPMSSIASEEELAALEVQEQKYREDGITF